MYINRILVRSISGDTDITVISVLLTINYTNITVISVLLIV